MRLLGGKTLARKTERKGAAMVIREGLPSRVVTRLGELWDLDEDNLVHIIGTSRRTLSRRMRATGSSLSPVESDRVFRFGRIMSRIEEVFSDKDIALDWANSPNLALSGDKPIEVLDTDAGVERVEEILINIEHGIYS